MLKGFATDACKRHWAVICCIIFFTFFENRRHIRLSHIISGPDPEMLLPGEGGGGTESRGLEPSGESCEGESMRGGGVNPLFIRGIRGGLPRIFFKNLCVSENAFQAILKPIFPYFITSILSKVRHSITLFFAINFLFSCHPLGALVRLCVLLWHSLGRLNNFLKFFG